MLSISDDGIISNEKAFLSGSVLGNTELFRRDELYRSLRPLMMTNLLSWIEVPLTRRSTSLVVLSGDFFITSAEIASEMAELFFCTVYNEAVDSFLALDLTTTSLSWTFAFRSEE